MILAAVTTLKHKGIRGDPKVWGDWLAVTHIPLRGAYGIVFVQIFQCCSEWELLWGFPLRRGELGWMHVLFLSPDVQVGMVVWHMRCCPSLLFSLVNSLTWRLVFLRGQSSALKSWVRSCDLLAEHGGQCTNWEWENRAVRAMYLEAPQHVFGSWGPLRSCSWLSQSRKAVSCLDDSLSIWFPIIWCLFDVPFCF